MLLTSSLAFSKEIFYLFLKIYISWVRLYTCDEHYDGRLAFKVHSVTLSCIESVLTWGFRCCVSSRMIQWFSIKQQSLDSLHEPKSFSVSLRIWAAFRSQLVSLYTLVKKDALFSFPSVEETKEMQLFNPSDRFSPAAPPYIHHFTFFTSYVSSYIQDFMLSTLLLLLLICFTFIMQHLSHFHFIVFTFGT